MATLIQNNTLSTGFLVESLRRFCVTNNFEYTPSASAIIKVKDLAIEKEVELCMNISEKSLAKEWANENDEHWESFLK